METECSDVRDKLEDYREGRLNRADQTSVEQHLHYCETCIHRWVVLREEGPEALCRV